MSIAGYNTKINTYIFTDPTADATYVLMRAPAGGMTIQAAYAATTAAIASHASNIITGSLLDGGADGSGTTSMGAGYGGANTAWGANEMNALVLTQTGLDGGDHLLFKYDEGGTVAPGLVVVQVEYTLGGT